MAIIARCLLVVGLLAGLPALAQQEPQQEPPARVGRVSVISGTLAYYGPGDGEWSAASVNLPVATGGWFATDPKSRAQLRIGADAVTLAADTQLNIADLRDGVMQIALSQGRIGLQLQKPAWRKDQTAEIDIARGGLWLLQPGDYDIDSGAPDQPTRISVFEGSARFVGGGVDKMVNAGERLVLTGGETLTAAVEKAARDDFADWCRDHGIRQDRVASARRVSPAMTGFEELDEYGEWATAADYGAVWYPKSVPADWAPYRSGRWVWVEPWGWNWVDDQPWGFAPFHYGRWAEVDDRWGWVPGEFVAQPVYAPALVAFIPQPVVEIAVAADAGPPIGWFPLAPGEVYWPSYTRNPTYLRNVNIANVGINLINRVTTAMLTRRGAAEPPPVVLSQRFLNRPAATIVPARVMLASAPVKPAVMRAPQPALRQAAVAALPPPPVARPAVAGIAAAAMPRHGRPPAGAPTAAAGEPRPHLPARPNFAQLAHAPRLGHGETAAVPVSLPNAAAPGRPAEAPAATAAIPPLGPHPAPDAKHGPPSRPDFANLPRWRPHEAGQQVPPGIPATAATDPAARRQAAQELAQQRAAAAAAARQERSDQRAAQQQSAIEKSAARQQEIAARLAQQRAAAEAAGQTRAAQRAAQQQAAAERRAAQQQALAARLTQQRAAHQAAAQQQAEQRAARQPELSAQQAQQRAAAEAARQQQAQQRASQQQAIAAQQAQQRAAQQAAGQQRAAQQQAIAAQRASQQAAAQQAAAQRAQQQQAVAAQRAQQQQAMAAQQAQQRAAAQQAAAQRAAQQQAMAAQMAQQRASQQAAAQRAAQQQAMAAQMAQQRAAQQAAAQQAAAQRAAQQQAQTAQHAQQRAAQQAAQQQKKQAQACGGPGQPACPPH